MFGEGISMTGDILDLAASVNIVNKSGAWYAYEGNKIGQGRENAKQYLKDNPEICAEIENKVREHYGLEKNMQPKTEEKKEDKEEKPKKTAKAAE
jgi:recombination protein RecA